MSVGDEDKPTKWLQREGQNMLPVTIIQDPLDVLFLRINFQQRECLNDKFQRRIFRYKIFLLFFQQKNVSSVFFIFRSRPLSLFFSLTFADLPPNFSFSLSFSCSIFQICGHNKLKLSTLDNTDTKTISHFRFRLY